MDPSIQDMAGSDGVSVHSGFPNPALDRRGQSSSLALDINRLLVRRPNSTYLFRISGHQWADQGIYDGDIAVIDRALRARTTDLVVRWDDTAFSLERRLSNPTDERPWGVVTAIIHQYERQ